jgi:hypothetical protein
VPFRFPCYRTFKHELGEFDAACEVIELARRELDGQAQASGKPSAYIQGLSEKHKVRVNTFDRAELESRTARFYVVSVHQRLEEFLLDLREAHPSFKDWNMTGDDDRLTKISRAVSLKRLLEFDVCQYYRKVRNAAVHSDAKVKAAKGDPKLRQRVEEDAKNREEEEAKRGKKRENPRVRLNAPSAYDEINFDDFILFSRCAKILAQELCLAVRPENAELARLAEEDEEVKALAKRFSDKPARIARLKIKYLRTEFSLDPNEARQVLENAR